MIKLGDIRAVVVFSDRPRTLADWYKGVFDLEEIFTLDHFIGLFAGSVSLFVQQTSEGHQPGMGGARFHFTVDDCEAALGELMAAGAAEVLGVTDTGGEYVAAAADPEGNPIGLLQPKRCGTID